MAQYYVSNSHPAIIDPVVHDLVQQEMQRRKAAGGRTKDAHPFSGKIFCGGCGSVFGRRVWNSTNQYRAAVWQCSDKYKSAKKCCVPHVSEKGLQIAFLAAFNRMLDTRAELLKSYRKIIQTLTDNTTLEQDTKRLREESEVLAALCRQLVAENAHAALDQADYWKRHNDLTQGLDEVEQTLGAVTQQIMERNAKRARLTLFLQTLSRQKDVVTTFNDELWCTTSDRVTVYTDRLVFRFNDGSEETVGI